MNAVQPLRMVVRISTLDICAAGQNSGGVNRTQNLRNGYRQNQSGKGHQKRYRVSIIPIKAGAVDSSPFQYFWSAMRVETGLK